MTDKKIPAVGTKLMVFRGHAKHTPGGLTRKDLFKNKKGRIVSRRQHKAGLKALKRLYSLGYKPKKGTFKAMRKSMVDGRKKKHTKKHGKKHGGAAGIVGNEAFADASGNMMKATAAAAK
jgi:hypothetical protein